MSDAWIRRYRFHLESVPELLLLSLSAVVPLAAARYDGAKVDGGGQEGYVPFSADAVDDADHLWALLVIYAQEVVYLIGGSAPEALRGSSWMTSEAQGTRAGIAPERVAAHAQSLVRWLVDRVHVIGPLEGLADSEEHLFALVRNLRAKYGVVERVRQNRARRCAVCDEVAVVGVYATVAGMEAQLVQCTECGASGEEAVGGEDDDADLLASGEAGEAVGSDDPTLEVLGDGDDRG